MQSRISIVLCLFVSCLSAQPPSTESQSDDTPVSVELRSGTVTAAIRSRPLHAVCEAIGSGTQIRIILADGIADDLVTLNVSSVPVEEAVRQLLANYDTFLFYGGSTRAAPLLRAVWVYQKGSASDIHPVPRSDWAGTKELELSLNDSNTQVREAAYAALLDRPDAQSRRLVLEAIRGIRERDSAVRERLLSTAMTKAFPFGVDVLSDLARTDTSEQIRWMALDALAFSESPSARVVAEAATMDSSELVRSRAQDMLTQLSQRRTVQRSDTADSPADPIH